MHQTGEPWRLGHRPALDGLRGVAVLLVVATHLAAFHLPDSAPDWLRIPGAGLGVDLFFVLSGFLITALLLEEWSREGRISIRGFYVRRARRLLPGALTVLGAWCLYALASGVRPEQVGRTVGAVLTYTTNYAKSSETDVILGLGHFWSLAVEEQFYLLWPLALVLLLSLHISERAILAAAMLAWAAVVVARLTALAAQPTLDVVFRTEYRCDGLLIGAALSIACRLGWVRPMTLVGTASLLALVAFALTAPASAFEGVAGAISFTIAALLSAAIILGRYNSGGFLTSAPMRYLGRVSYSLYLWHVPVIVFIDQRYSGWSALPIAAIASLILAALSYRYVEKPWLRKRVDLHLRRDVVAAQDACVHVGRR